MLHDSEDRPMRAVPSQIPLAPLAGAAAQVDLAHHAASDQIRGIGLDHFADELVSGDARKAVVSALQFQVGIADPGAKHAQKRKTRWTRRKGRLAHFDAASFEPY